MKAIDAVLAHMTRVGMLYEDVPEWAVDGKPLRIFYTPLTLADKDQLGDLKAADLDARVLMVKALDAKGASLFDLEDMVKMKMAGCASVISRVSGVIANAPTPEQAAKNLKTTKS